MNDSVEPGAIKEPNMYRRLLPFLRPHGGLLTATIVTSLSASLLDAFSVALLIPFLNILFNNQTVLPVNKKWVTGLLQAVLGGLMVPGDKMASLRNVIFVIMGVVVVKNLLVWRSGQLGASLQENITSDLRNAVYKHLARLPLGYFMKMKAGQILSRVINDTYETRLVLTQINTQALQAGSFILMSLAFLLALSPKLTLLSLVIVPLLSVIMQPLLRKLRRGNRRRGNQHGEMTSVLQETVSGIRLVKAFSAEGYEEHRFVTASNLYGRTTIRLSRLTFMAQPVTEVMGMLIAVALLWIGARQVVSARTMTGADLVTFLLAVLRLLAPLKQITAIPAQAQSSFASAERLFDILDTPTERALDSGTRTVGSFDRDLVFDHVTFAYDTAPVLRDVSFRAQRGDVIALVGPSGAGKSTLVDLIPRFYELTGGRILLDGVDTRNVTLDSLRSLIGIVSQDTVLFHDTVRNNIAYGAATRYTDEQIEAAARAANAHGFISALPEGYNTILGERGTRLSGGQRQRIAIARALLCDPPMLILDEATSALDTESERLVQAAVDRLLEGRTVFVIAHRLSTVQHATQILVLHDGEITERGTHAELLAMQGTYARLYALQFRNGDAAAPAEPVASLA